MTQPRAYATADEFADYLAAHHDTADEAWIAFPKKGTDATSVTRSEAQDVALCYGWIDGKATSQNAPDGWWALRFTPRRPRSVWSKVNRIRVEKLIRAGRMRPAGLAQIDLAKADGRWDAAYDSPSRVEVPPELATALAAEPAAASAFAALPASSRYTILVTLQRLKRQETRERRIATYVARLAAGEPPHAPIPR